MKTSIALALTLVASTAAAERDRVELVTEGAAKSNAGDHGAAIALYEQAYLQQPDPLLLPILASEYARAGLPVDAIRYFCEYLEKQPRGMQAAYATKQLVALRTLLGESTAKARLCEAPKPVRVDFVTPRPTREPRPGQAGGTLLARPVGGRSPGMSRREMAGIASAAIGVASLTASLLYQMEAKSISDDISNHSASEAWPANIHALQARGQRYENRSELFLLAGGAALVTGGILYFTGRADRVSSETAIIAPTVSPDGAGISFARGF